MRRAKGVRLWLETRKGRPSVYTIRDGSRKISTGCGAEDVEGANKALADYLATHFRPNTGERDLSRITCAEVLMLYAQDMPADKPSRALVGYHMKALLPFWGEKTLDQVKGSTCRAYMNGRTGLAVAKSSETKRLVSGSTVRRELKTLQAAINHWHRESPLEAVPKVSLPPESPRRERVLERSEVARLLLACRRLSRRDIIMHNGAKLRISYMHVARFILIGIYTGTRHDAILRLRWASALSGGHVDIERRTIFRRGSAEPETSKRRPPVRVVARLSGHIRRWKRADESNGADRIIHYKGAAVSKLRRSWDRVVREAGLGKDVTPHTLRHTCASWLLWNGATIWDVAGVIGADASTVERVYGHHRRVEQDKRERA